MTDLNRVSSGQPSLSREPDDATLDEEAGVGRSPERPAGGDARTRSASSGEASQGPAPGVQRLVSQYSPIVPTANNAQRTSGREPSPYAQAGVTSTGDTLYAGAAAMKGRDSKTGVEVEVFSASVQVGGENEAQAGLARAGISGKNGSIGVEVFTARAAGGAYNDDGSIGMNSGAQVTLVGAETTARVGNGSATVGLSVSHGAALSVGIKDADGDGKPEFCVRMSLGPVTLGMCVED